MGTETLVENCRLCQSSQLIEVLDLGHQCYTGRFPGANESDPAKADLAIVRCKDCSLVQLKHYHPADEMYGDTYGYQSSITETMRNHLNEVKDLALKWSDENNSEINVLDIGSNDGTLLNFFSQATKTLVGIDPCAKKHAEKYPESALAITDFFSEASVKENASDIATAGFDIITSIAMFYDIDKPVNFATDIHNLLSEDGIWITEQSHCHALIDSNCYDSICHEHATYLSLRDMEHICEKSGLRIIDIHTNDINGGSFALVITKKGSKHTANKDSIESFRNKETQLGLGQEDTWIRFRTKVEEHRNTLSTYLIDLHKQGKKVFGYGASTKGNVLLQYCGITNELMPAILERDPKKYGKLTPGTRIPIISEAEGRSKNPDVLVVFPWHFKEEIIKREKSFLEKGGKLLFPLPKPEVISYDPDERSK